MSQMGGGVGRVVGPDRQKTVVVTMVHYYPDHPSGSGRIAFDEATYLAASGHKVWVLAQKASDHAPVYEFRDGLHVLRYSRPRLALLDPRRAGAHQREVGALLDRFLGGSDVDLLHGHSLLQFDGARIYFGLRVRQCYSMHSPAYLEKLAEIREARGIRHVGLQMVGKILRRVEKRCIDEAQVVTAFSDYTRTLIGEEYGSRAKDRTVVIPGWVDMKRFDIVEDRAVAKSALGWPRDVPVLFTLRRLVPRMGLDGFLRALSIVQAAGVRFCAVVAGEGRLRNGLEMLTRDLGLAERVSFPGRISETLLPTMYAAADAFVLPTAELECFGLIALESFACGRPVLATRIGAIPEVVGAFEPRWLAQDATPDSLAQHLISFLNGQLPNHDPQALRALVQTRYSRESVLERFVNAAFGT